MPKLLISENVTFTVYCFEYSQDTHSLEGFIAVDMCLSVDEFDFGFWLQNRGECVQY